METTETIKIINMGNAPGLFKWEDNRVILKIYY